MAVKNKTSQLDKYRTHLKLIKSSILKNTSISNENKNHQLNLISDYFKPDNLKFRFEDEI